MQSHEQLSIALDSLEAQLPVLRKQYPDMGEFARVFGVTADLIADNAGPQDVGFVSRRLDEMLKGLGPL